MHSNNTLYSFLISFPNFFLDLFILFLFVVLSYFCCFLLTHLTFKELDPTQPQKQLEDQKRVGTEFGFTVVWSRTPSLTHCFHSMALTRSPLTYQCGTCEEHHVVDISFGGSSPLGWLEGYFGPEGWCRLLIYTKAICEKTEYWYMLRRESSEGSLRSEGKVVIINDCAPCFFQDDVLWGQPLHSTSFM